MPFTAPLGAGEEAERVATRRVEVAARTRPQRLFAYLQMPGHRVISGAADGRRRYDVNRPDNIEWLWSRGHNSRPLGSGCRLKAPCRSVDGLRTELRPTMASLPGFDSNRLFRVSRAASVASTTGVATWPAWLIRRSKLWALTVISRRERLRTGLPDKMASKLQSAAKTISTQPDRRLAFGIIRSVESASHVLMVT